MRAAPGRADLAPGVIARKSRRNDIAAVLVTAQSSRIKVNSALISCGTALLVAEEATLVQAQVSTGFIGFERAFAIFQLFERLTGDFWIFKLELL
jgi:hypothetical protein